jgi:hypothetical protein
MQKYVVTGRITLVQEERFRLVSGDDRAFVFTTSRKSPLCLADLQHLLKSYETIRVEYSGVPNTCSGIADAVALVAD